jgi:hypothetical protein
MLKRIPNRKSSKSRKQTVVEVSTVNIPVDISIPGVSLKTRSDSQKNSNNKT